MILNTLSPACRRKAFDLVVEVMPGPAGGVASLPCDVSIGVSVGPRAAVIGRLR